MMTLGIFCAVLAVVAAGKPSAAQEEPRLSMEKVGPGEVGPLSPAQQRAISQGYLVPDQGAYERAKAAANENAGRISGGESQAAPAAEPQVFRSWRGIRDTRLSPSDSTGAIGPGRYMELVNSQFAIYNRTENVPLSTGTLNELAGLPSDAFVFDPQVMWDPTTRRFYYVSDAIFSSGDTRLALGFSKTANPASPADFCQYNIKTGPRFPDYPKLGDSGGLLLVGVNSFDITTETYLGSDLISITKPPPGNECPAPDEFTLDREFDLQGADGDRAWTPVPANQTDTAPPGYVVAVALEDDTPTVGGNLLSLYKVNENADGTMTVGDARGLTVPTYSVLASAPQPDSPISLDSLDGRNTQAVMAQDPDPGKFALWTQHTVFGGSGAEVRWYEIDPARVSLLQAGKLSKSDGTFFFNAAISPDRQVNGSTRRFGDNAFIGYNTSSESSTVDIQVVSKQGDDPISDPRVVKTSPTSLEEFNCTPTCRWGDYSSATPDPNVPPLARQGSVWFSNQWVQEPGDEDSAGWGSWNWAAKP